MYKAVLKWGLYVVLKAHVCVGDSGTFHVASCFANESMFSTINQKAPSCHCNPMKASGDGDTPKGESGPHFCSPSITDPLG